MKRNSKSFIAILVTIILAVNILWGGQVNVVLLADGFCLLN